MSYIWPLTPHRTPQHIASNDGLVHFIYFLSDCVNPFLALAKSLLGIEKPIFIKRVLINFTFNFLLITRCHQTDVLHLKNAYLFLVDLLLKTK